MPTTMNNYSPVIIADTSDMDEATWHTYRRQGLGGSDIAAVYGQSPFCTARDLYYVKLGVKPEIEEEENWVAKKYGHLLEDLVAEIFSRKTGYRVYKKSYLYAHPDYPFMQANVDYFVELPDGSEAILECKTCNYNCRDKWDNDTVPFNYELQVRHYMAVTNLQCALVSTNKPPAMLVEPKCFSFKLKKKTSCSKMEVVWRPHSKYRRNER